MTRDRFSPASPSRNYYSTSDNAFEFLGSSTPVIVPDNLKTGVRPHPREGEVALNPAYEEMAVHYGAAVIPARLRRPRDKAGAENEM